MAILGFKKREGLFVELVRYFIVIFFLEVKTIVEVVAVTVLDPVTAEDAATQGQEVGIGALEAGELRIFSNNHSLFVIRKKIYPYHIIKSSWIFLAKDLANRRTDMFLLYGVDLLIGPEIVLGYFNFINKSAYGLRPFFCPSISPRI